MEYKCDEVNKPNHMYANVVGVKVVIMGLNIVGLVPHGIFNNELENLNIIDHSTNSILSTICNTQ